MALHSNGQMIKDCLCFGVVPPTDYEYNQCENRIFSTVTHDAASPLPNLGNMTTPIPAAGQANPATPQNQPLTYDSQISTPGHSYGYSVIGYYLRLILG